ncbi:MAG TPA: hypothetical protein VL860_11675 [Planctomycetota bacterium]|nr:hypothetical protein [Planctomycetota bacterium]
MASDPFSRLHSDPGDQARGGVNAPMRSPAPETSAGRRPYQNLKPWEIHPHDPYALVRDGHHFLPLGVYARAILQRRDADVGRLLLSMAAHRANCMAWDLLPEVAETRAAAEPPSPAPLLPWPVDRVSGPDFTRFASTYFARLEVLLHAVSESDLAILLRAPSPRQADALNIPRDAWRKFLIEVADCVKEYSQVAFAIDIDGYDATASVLASHLPEFCGAAYIAVRGPAKDTPLLARTTTLSPRPRLLWIHNDSLLTPQFGAPEWPGPILCSYSRPSDVGSIVPRPGIPSEDPGHSPAALAVAFGGLMQGTGLLWAYNTVGIFQSPLRDLAPVQSIARLLDTLNIEWTGLSAARHLFAAPIVDQPLAAMARSGQILAYYPHLHAAGIRMWLKPVAHQVTWYKPLEAAPVYTTSGIVGLPGAPASIPAPQALVGQAALLALVPEN